MTPGREQSEERPNMTPKKKSSRDQITDQVSGLEKKSTPWPSRLFTEIYCHLEKKFEQPQSIIINALKSWIIYYIDWYDVVVGWMKARREGGRGLDPGGHDDAAVVGVGFQRVDNLLQLVDP